MDMEGSSGMDKKHMKDTFARINRSVIKNAIALLIKKIKSILILKNSHQNNQVL